MKTQNSFFAFSIDKPRCHAYIIYVSVRNKELFMFQSPAESEKQAKFFAVDAALRARAAYNKNSQFFNSQSQQSKVNTVVARLKELLRVNNVAYFEKIIETARDQKAKGVFTDVTVYKFIPNRYVSSSDVVCAMQSLGFTAQYNPRSANIKITVK